MKSVPGVIQLLSKWAWSGFLGGSCTPRDSKSALILAMSSIFSLEGNKTSRRHVVMKQHLVGTFLKPFTTLNFNANTYVDLYRGIFFESLF